MRQRPDVQGHHQSRWPAFRRHGGDQLLDGFSQYTKAPLARFAQLRTGLQRNAGFEHGGVIGRLVSRKLQICPTEVSKCSERIGTAAVPGLPQGSLELLETAPRDIGQELVAVAEVPIRSCGAHAGPAGCLREGDPCRPFLRDQDQRGPDQRLLEIAMVITAGTRWAALFGPAHVKRIYMTRPGRSNRRTLETIPPAQYRVIGGLLR